MRQFALPVLVNHLQAAAASASSGRNKCRCTQYGGEEKGGDHAEDSGEVGELWGSKET